MPEPTRDQVRRALDQIGGTGPVAVWLVANRINASLADTRAVIARMIADDQLIDCVAVPWWNQ